uniref:Peptidase C1A papain C-terminal domain-containing protein n=1 Tax=Florenciella parvula TaxID=236787 RepID=A0A7S2CIF1_9STRA
MTNARVIDELNAENDGATYALNQFADLTAEEFAQSHLTTFGKVPRAALDAKVKGSGTDTDTPDELDWRDMGAVTEVKDQGALGSCWAFSTAGNLEGQLFLSGSQLTSLSVEQLLECDSSYDVAQGHADCGEFGGWPYLAMQYVIDAGGLRSDAVMPYCAGIGYGQEGYCIPCMPEGYSKALCGDYDDDDQIPLFCDESTTLGQGPAGYCSNADGVAVTINDWKAISTNETTIAAELAATGPLSIALNAQRLQFYKSGVYNPSSCNPDNLDHAVLMVGFGTDDIPYWTIKNSWGTSWGEDGYFRIVRGTGACGVNTAVVSGLI